MKHERTYRIIYSSFVGKCHPAQHGLHHSTCRRIHAVRFRSTPMDGLHCRQRRHPPVLALALSYIRTVECIYNLLGMQRHSRRRHFRCAGKRRTDERGMGTFQGIQEKIQGSPSIHIPRSSMDSMGTILLRCRDLMAVAGAWQCIRAQHYNNPMVRNHRPPGRFTMGMGMQPCDLRAHRCAE